MQPYTSFIIQNYCDFSDVLVSSMDSDITYEGLIAEMKDICRFDEHQPFTMKWVDEEGGSVFYSLASMNIIGGSLESP